jgi:nucleoside-diphosphate-sugar epimerase
MTSLVFGATGTVGDFILTHPAQRGETVIGASRSPRSSDGMSWIAADLTRPQALALPNADVIFCATNVRLFAKAIGAILPFAPKRIVVLSSTSIFTKLDSKDEAERSSIAELADAEHAIIDRCEAARVEWTILRPTLVYREGHDRNVTQIAGLIRRLGFMPLYGTASGLRQPVHAEDLAIGAIAAAASPKAANAAYCTTGLETISYREMVGRIFDGLSRPRRLLSLPPIVWKSAFALAKPIYPRVTPVMGEQMLKDLAFDSSAATRDFGWRSRKFAPSF